MAINEFVLCGSWSVFVLPVSFDAVRYVLVVLVACRPIAGGDSTLKESLGVWKGLMSAREDLRLAIRACAEEKYKSCNSKSKKNKFKDE